MRIAHLISTYIPVVGGAQICIHNIASRHVQQGHDVTIHVPRSLAKKNFGSYQMTGMWPGTMWLLHHCFAIGQWYLLQQVRLWQKQNHFDLWQVTIGYPVGSAIVSYLNKKNIPAVLRCAGEDLQIDQEVSYGMRLDPVVDQRVRKTYPFFNACVAISPTVEEEYRQLEIEKERIHIIRNGVDVQRFQQELTVQRRCELRDHYCIPEGKKILLTVGRNHPKKGFVIIPELINLLAKDYQDFVWVCVGQGYEPIQQEAERLGVGNYLRLINGLGLQPDATEFPGKDLIEWYQLADAFVFPTKMETFGIVVVEAMAAGCYVVTTNAPGVRDIVTDGQDAAVVSIGDVEGFMDALSQLWKTPEKIAQQSRQALATAESYDWRHIADEYLKLYGALVR